MAFLTTFEVIQGILRHNSCGLHSPIVIDVGTKTNKLIRYTNSKKMTELDFSSREPIE